MCVASGTKTQPGPSQGFLMGTSLPTTGSSGCPYQLGLWGPAEADAGLRVIHHEAEGPSHFVRADLPSKGVCPIPPDPQHQRQMGLSGLLGSMPSSEPSLTPQS